MFVVKREEGILYSLPGIEIGMEQTKALNSQLARDILAILAKEPSYSKDIAKKLKMHEQKIYYHMNKLEKSGIIKLIKKETISGATANYYAIAEPSLVIRFKDFEKTQKITQHEDKKIKFWEPFVEEGKLNALIVVGSPVPHGPDKARSRDAYYGMDLALFLGTFLNYVPESRVKLDTEIKKEDLKNNLILLGGPITNKTTGKVLGIPAGFASRLIRKMPLTFDEKRKWNIKSFSGKSYSSEETGIIFKAQNPFDKKKKVMIIAGKRYFGTRAAIIAILKYFDEIVKGNIYDRRIQAKVVEGVDLDSDGVIDDVEFRE